jgi:hypothetical protein
VDRGTAIEYSCRIPKIETAFAKDSQPLRFIPLEHRLMWANRVHKAMFYMGVGT